VIEENGGRGHATPTPNELGKEQEDEETLTFLTYKIMYVDKS
jgi:hypothetical protein